MMTSSMVECALKNAKSHGINLIYGCSTPSNGDCAFIAIADNISQRDCFKYV